MASIELQWCIHDGVVLCLEGKCGVLLGRGAEERLMLVILRVQGMSDRAHTHTQKVRRSFGVIELKITGFVQSVGPNLLPLLAAACSSISLKRVLSCHLTHDSTRGET